MTLQHFSPYDYNRLRNGIAGAETGDGLGRRKRAKRPEDDRRRAGSIIEPIAQVLGESLPLAGSTLRLIYRSDETAGRTDGREVHLDLPTIVDDSPIEALVYELRPGHRNVGRPGLHHHRLVPPRGARDLGNERGGGAPLWQVDRTFNATSRVVSAADTTPQGTVLREFSYDAVGRLTSVDVDGTETYRYQYDDNGNLVEQMGPEGGVIAVYDDRDRLVSAGTQAFGDDPMGALSAIVDSGATTLLEHGVDGALHTVTLPSGDQIEYLHDHQQRRVARLLNGALTAAWPRDPWGRVAAELDANGQLLSTFWYGDDDRVPEAMEREGRV